MASSDGSKVAPCNCKQTYQDKRYGNGQRLHNAQQGKNKGKFRCTACGSSKG
jgi:hypothetical protein